MSTSPWFESWVGVLAPEFDSDCFFTADTGDFDLERYVRARCLGECDRLRTGDLDQLLECEYQCERLETMRCYVTQNAAEISGIFLHRAEKLNKTCLLSLLTSLLLGEALRSLPLRARSLLLDLRLPSQDLDRDRDRREAGEGDRCLFLLDGLSAGLFLSPLSDLSFASTRSFLISAGASLGFSKSNFSSLILIESWGSEIF